MLLWTHLYKYLKTLLLILWGINPEVTFLGHMIILFFKALYTVFPEMAMAPHSSTLAWKIPWMEKPGRLQSMGSLGVGQTEWLHFHFSLSCTGEGNGNPLQCSCLENPRDGGAWWAAICGVTQSRTQLKRLSSSSSKVRKTREMSISIIIGSLTVLIFAERLSNIRTEKCPCTFGSMNFIESKWNLFLNKMWRDQKNFKKSVGWAGIIHIHP